MSALKTTDPLALKLLFSDELYLISNERFPALTNQTEVVSEKKVGITERESFDYLGENNKYILVIVNQPQSQYISPENLEALKNILAAKNQELRDVAILNLAKYPGSHYEQLKDFFACNKMIFFGINPKEIGFSEIPANKTTTVESTQVLATYSFEDMLADTTKKRLFWNEMKQF